MRNNEQETSRQSRRSLLKAGVALAAGTALAAPTVVEASASADNSPGQREPMVRRNAKNLSSAEKIRLVDAIHGLKRTQSPIDPSLSYYDQFVRFHQLAVLRTRLELGHSIAHQSPSFLPWHRKLVLTFEAALREVARDPVLTLPYWDWTDEASLPLIFNDDFMGPTEGESDDNYAVTTGHFRKDNFPVNLTASSIGPDDTLSRCPFPFLTRGPKGDIKLPTSAEVTALLTVKTYDTPPYDVTADIEKSFRNYILGMPDDSAPSTSLQGQVRLHSLPHIWLGGQWEATAYSEALDPVTMTFVGTMAALDCSPNDPAFWLHHSNVDRLWAIWETANGATFEPDSGEYLGWNLDNTLYPFSDYQDSPQVAQDGYTNRSMLNFRQLGYTYEEL